MALLLVKSGDQDPEWIQKLKAQIGEISKRDDILAEAEKEARENGDIRKLNKVLALRRRNDLDIKSRMGLLAHYERHERN